VPNNKPFTVRFTYREDGLIDTLRYGHRYDANWGDANVKGFNPNPEIVGGYFYDVIIKNGRSFEDAMTYLY
jgi:hypothetical protein